MIRYVNAETIRLWLSGLIAASVAGIVWRMAGRSRWGATPLVLAVVAAARYAGRFDVPRWDGPAVVGGILIALSGAGAARLLGGPASWPWFATAALISATAVWAGVPETGPALVVGGALAGFAISAAVSRSCWAPAAGIGVAAALGWAALSGAAGQSWALVGGALCTGVAPWFALRPLLPVPSWSRWPGPWLLGAHLALVVLAARWIAVVPHAGWHRVTVIVAAGLAVTIATRQRA